MGNTTTRIESGDVAVTCDAFLGGTVELRQPIAGYRAGLDAVLLAAAVPESKKSDSVRLLDVGAGVGTVGLCAAARLASIDVTLVEKSPQLCHLAEDNIAANRLEARVCVIESDITKNNSIDHRLADNSFDVTVSNPPFYDASRHRQSPHALKAASHAMPDAGLDGWLRFMARMTKSGGTAIVIHRADLLPELLAAFTPRFGAIALLALRPRENAPASRVILRGIKGSRAPLRILPGICLHAEGNGFTPKIDRVLKSPAALDWGTDI
jgi:tRNA1(Val) A37 N6-methylase TrmN6